jgi:Na+-driven multidrug efflux pump
MGPIPALGALGNGLSSTVAEFAGLAYLLVVARKTGLGRQLRDNRRAERPRISGQIASLNVPAMTSMSLDYVANIVWVALIGALGMTFLAANRIAFYFVIAYVTVVLGFSTAAQILIGRVMGDGDFLAVRQYRRWALVLMVAVISLLSLPALVAPRAIVELFTGFSEVVSPAAGALKLIALAAPVMAWCFSGVAQLRALGHTKLDMYANVGATWLVQLPLAWWLGIEMQWHLNGIYAAFLAYWCCRAVVTELMIDAMASRPSVQVQST